MVVPQVTAPIKAALLVAEVTTCGWINKHQLLLQKLSSPAQPENGGGGRGWLVKHH